ncbi:GDP-L-fucose synthase [Paenibacillus sp. PAMC21692]|uniref:GDP-L-fucose synthase family protein n=1 Tax=Paenibacillus sp. PAMC21692 TaxID=2762320 RepID=UPI00164E4E30|nr:GDP-L-fucose synthase [Paenibacillus sp. PAMC21692]QNK58176.1 GDP-L-fucose synthase [Paenibacillus sp. PAMC21692]
MSFSLTNKRILVTGANGFLGSHFIEEIKKEPIKELLSFSSKEYDLRNEENVKQLFSNIKVDVVIHIAADVGGIGYSSSHPGIQFYNNVMINTLIQHYSLKAKVEKFVGLGSVCEYPAETLVPFKEEDLWNGYPVETNDAYGLSKRMLLAQSIAYKKEFGFNAIHLLPVNLYGPKDNFDINNSHVIPALIRKIHHAKINNLDTVEVWGTGEESREFLYVEDAAKALLKATKFYNEIDPVNIGTGYETKIREIASIIARIIGYKGKFAYNNLKPGGQKRRQLDVTKAEKLFNFKASTSLENGLENTVEYYTNNIYGR